MSGVYYGSTWFFNGFAAGLKAFTAAVLGGIGNIAGAMLGGFLIGLVEALTTQTICDQWANVVVFSMLVLVLIFRPTGLLGESRAEQGMTAAHRIAPGTRIAVIAFAVALALPFIGHNGAFTNFLADAGAFVLLALGLNIVVGFAGLLDLGYAAFFAIGSYAFAMLASPQFGIHLPFWVLLFVASAIAAVFGILLGAPTLRLRGDYLAIVTLGFGEIVPQTFLNLSQWTGGPNGIGSLDQPVFFGLRFGFDPLPYYLLILALIALAVIVANNLRRSRLGRAWMAIREDELAAAHMGINTTTARSSPPSRWARRSAAWRAARTPRSCSWSRPTSSGSTSACSSSPCSCWAAWVTSRASSRAASSSPRSSASSCRKGRTRCTRSA